MISLALFIGAMVGYIIGATLVATICFFCFTVIELLALGASLVSNDERTLPWHLFTVTIIAIGWAFVLIGR